MRMRVVMLHCHPVQATWHLHRITRRQLNLCCFVFSPTSTPWIQRNKHSQPIVLFFSFKEYLERACVTFLTKHSLLFFAIHYWSRTWVGLFWSQPKRNTNTCWVSLSFCSFGQIIKCTSAENQMQIYFHFQTSLISLEYAVKHKAMCCARQSPSDSRRCRGRTAVLSWTMMMMMVMMVMTMMMMMMVMTRRTRMMRRVTPWSFAERVPP